MITAKAWAGKHFAVYGLARSGLATVRALLASGARVTAWDEREAARAALEQEGRSSRAKSRGADESATQRPSTTLGTNGVQVADLDTADLSQFDSLVVSPGVPLNTHPLAARARAANLEIIGDIELFARTRAELPPHKVVGITGTNGKSTTTALVHHILKNAGVPTTMGGNIGLPILAQAPLTPNDSGVGVYVLELSSFQIDLTKSLDCDVAVLLNITPDHLDRYESFEAYAASKFRLLDMQSQHQWQLMPCTHPAIAEEFRKRSYTDYQIVEALESYPVEGQPGWPSLKGPHNAQNAAAAIGVCQLMDLSDEQIAEGLRTYPGLPHRMERVRDKAGVIFINDSKATNPEATAPALAAYPKARWIVGGQAKTHDLGDTAKHLEHVVHAYTIGEAGPMFAQLLRERGVQVTETETLENAVNRAAADSQSGEVVLLSPACASFDQFRDFEARGDAFKRLVGEL